MAGGRQRGGLPGLRLRASGAPAGARPLAPAVGRAGAGAPLPDRGAALAPEPPQPPHGPFAALRFVPHFTC